MVELAWLEASYILVKITKWHPLVCVQQDRHCPGECMLWEHTVYHRLKSILLSLCGSFGSDGSYSKQ